MQAPNYLCTNAARREFLEGMTDALKSFDFADSPAYWREIGCELARIWITRIQEEAKQNREWVRLDIQVSNDTLYI